MALTPEKYQQIKTIYNTFVQIFGTTLEDKNIEEFRTMSSKVILQLASNNKLFDHPLFSLAKKIDGDVYGSSVEEYYTLQAKAFNKSDVNKTTLIPIQEYITYQHKINFQKIYAISEPQNIKHVLKSESNFVDFIDAILLNLTNTYKKDQLNNILELLKNIKKVATKVVVSGLDIDNEAHTAPLNVQHLSNINTVIEQMKLPGSQFALTYQKNGTKSTKVEVFSTKIYMIVDTNYYLEGNDGNNPTKFLSRLQDHFTDIRVIEVPGFGAPLLIDDNTIKCFTTKFKLTSDYQAPTDTQEYFLHVDEIYNFSPFSNAVTFVNS